jgi:hypothetical protein
MAKRIRDLVALFVSVVALAGAASGATVKILGLVTQEQLIAALVDTREGAVEKARSADAILIERQGNQYQALRQEITDIKTQLSDIQKMLMAAKRSQ